MLRRESQTLLLEGPVTLAAVPGLIAAAGACFREGVTRVDFAAVTEVDSAAVALAIEWLRQAKAADVSLRLDNLPVAMQDLATLYGVSDLLSPAAA